MGEAAVPRNQLTPRIAYLLHVRRSLHVGMLDDPRPCATSQMEEPKNETCG